MYILEGTLIICDYVCSIVCPQHLQLVLPHRITLEQTMGKRSFLGSLVTCTPDTQRRR